MPEVRLVLEHDHMGFRNSMHAIRETYAYGNHDALKFNPKTPDCRTVRNVIFQGVIAFKIKILGALSV
ncbi:MAG: hypothetical protein WA151_17325, partial [Desulfatirhabdiaceae bacterium]